MTKPTPSGARRAILAILIGTALSTPVASDTTDAITYALDGDDLRITGPFSKDIGFVTIRGVVTDVPGKGPVEPAQAAQAIDSLFQLRIGDDFRELFGDGTEIDLETYGDASESGALHYDYANLRGACLRRDNGQMAVMIDLKQGGTANAGTPPDTVFIFSDANKVRFEVISRDDWTDATCLDTAREAAAYAERVRQQQTELMAAIVPSGVDMQFNGAGFPVSLDVAPLTADPRPQLHAHFEANSAYYRPAFCEGKADLYIEECAKTQSTVERVFESEQYDIHRAKFIRNCASEGIDLLHHKTTDTWTTLFRNLAGCSKYYLCVPDYHDVNGQVLTADIPVDCIHWGDWQSVQINLDDFALSPK